MLVLFVCKDLSPLYKSSNTRNHLKPENLETLFLLSTLKMPITSVTSYKEKIKILRRPLTLLWLLDFATVYSYFNIQLCSYLMLEIKSFVSLKNESFLFWTRVQFKGELSYTLIPWRTLWTYLIKDLAEVLTHFIPLTSGFLMFSEGIKRDQWHEMDY